MRTEDYYRCAENNVFLKSNRNFFNEYCQLGHLQSNRSVGTSSFGEREATVRFKRSKPYHVLVVRVASLNVAKTRIMASFSPVAYAESFHGVDFHSIAYGGHLHLVCSVCDVSL